jgi:hypothetical protein
VAVIGKCVILLILSGVKRRGVLSSQRIVHSTSPGLHLSRLVFFKARKVLLQTTAFYTFEIEHHI